MIGTSRLKETDEPEEGFDSRMISARLQDIDLKDLDNHDIENDEERMDDPYDTGRIKKISNK